MENDKQTCVDGAVITLSYLFTKGALYLNQVLDKTGQNLLLEKDLTPAQKSTLKTDAGFTSKAISYLTRAGEAFRTLNHCLEMIESELDQRIHHGSFDSAQADMYDLLSVCLPYMVVTAESPENEKKIHNYLQKYRWPADLKEVYKLLRFRRDTARR